MNDASELNPAALPKTTAQPAALSGTEESVGVKVGRYRWVICGLLFFATTVNYVDRQVLGILSKDLQQAIGWTEVDYGNIVAAFNAAYAFGLVMAGACCFIAGLGYWSGSSRWPYWSAAAIAFFSAAWLWPAVLAPLNRVWFRLGRVLHRVVNPLVMGVLFFVVITPIGLLMRLFGERPLPLEFDREATSYWLARNTTELQPGPMTRQY